MTNLPTSKEAQRKSASSAHASSKAPDACEILLLELQARRVRLQELLQLVRQEAMLRPSPDSAGRRLHRCTNPRTSKQA
jgi:hypothetical protein